MPVFRLSGSEPWPLTAGHSGVWLCRSDAASLPSRSPPCPCRPSSRAPSPAQSCMEARLLLGEKAARQAAGFRAPPPPRRPRSRSQEATGASVSCRAMGPCDAPRHPIQGPLGSAARLSSPQDSQPPLHPAALSFREHKGEGLGGAPGWGSGARVLTQLRVFPLHACNLP